MHTFGHKAVHERGAFAVEFALIIPLFLLLIFGIIEVARVMYMFNTLQEVTRSAASAAATTNFRDVDALDLVRQNAIFRNDPGELLLGSPITDAYIRIDYMALVRDAGGNSQLTPIPAATLPGNPARNRVTCMSSPNDAGCIRFVRVRICDPENADACEPVRYTPLVPLVDLPINLPMATTIRKAGTVGYMPGMAP